MKLTDCQYISFVRIANPYVYYITGPTCRQKKLTSSAIAPQYPQRRQPCTANHHCDSSPRPNQPQDGMRSFAERIRKWRMKKKKPTNVEEEVNKGKFGIFKKLLV